MRNKNSHKTCKKCKGKEIKKDGFMRGKQRYSELAEDYEVSIKTI